MTSRFPGLVPAFALLAMGVAHAQVTNQTGSMAYPQSNPSGQVQIPAPTARDTGGMAYPASPGGVTEAAPTGRDTGGMMTPTNQASLNTRPRAMAPARMAAARGGDPANSMRPDVAPTPAETATARALDAGPTSAAVPYTDFLPPARPMGKMAKGKMAMHRMSKPVHHAVMRKAAAAAASPAATPAAAPAAAAPAAAAPAK